MPHYCCGLFYLFENRPKPIPLTGVHASVLVKNAVAEVLLLQHFCNEESTPIEALYAFPLDANAAVCSFSVETDGKELIGVVKGAEEALQDYNRAVSQGKKAALLEQEKGDIFQISVGNLMPKHEMLVKIKYVCPLENVGETVQLVIPSAIAPRYTPLHSISTVGNLGASTSNTDGSVVGLSLDIAVEMASEITEISSATHSVKAEITQKTAQVELAEALMKLDRDFVLKIKQQQPFAPAVTTETDPATGSTAAMVSLCPQIKLPDLPHQEFILVVDRSGSMSGAKIQQVQLALQLFLRSLPVGCTFDIVSFGSRFSSLFDWTPKAYSRETLQRASNHVSGMRADYGGTELMNPLQMVFGDNTATTYKTTHVQHRPFVVPYFRPGIIFNRIRQWEPWTWITRTVATHKQVDVHADRQIFVLTDGQINNTNEVIDYVREKTVGGNAGRVFTLGIGDSVSHDLVRRLAAAGGGVSEFVTTSESLEEKVIHLLDVAAQPCLTYVAVEWRDDKGEILAATGDPIPSAHAPPSGSAVSGDGPTHFKRSPLHAMRKPRPGEAPVGSLLNYGAVNGNSPAAAPAPAAVMPFPTGFGPNNTVMAPYRPRCITSEKLFTSAAIFPKGSSLPSSVVIRAMCPDGPLETVLDVPAPTATAETPGLLPLHTVCARNALRDLEDGQGFLAHTSESAVREASIALGTYFSLTSQYTSFVVVDQDVVNPYHFVESRRVAPQAFAANSAPPIFGGGFRGRSRGGGGGRGPPMMKMMSASRPAAPPAMTQSCARRNRAAAPTKRKKKGFFVSDSATNSLMMPEEEEEMMKGDVMMEGDMMGDDYSSDDEEMPLGAAAPSAVFSFSAPAPAPGSTPDAAEMHQLISAQDFDGSFSLTTSFAAVLGIPLDTLNAYSRTLGLTVAESDLTLVWATALAVAYLRQHCAARAKEWFMLEKKALKFLGTATAGGEPEAVVAKAAEFLSRK